MDSEPSAAPPPRAQSDPVDVLLRELEERKALTEAVFAASCDGICILDRGGIFLEVNAAFERLTQSAVVRKLKKYGIHLAEGGAED